MREVVWGTEGAVNLVGYDNTVQDMYVPFFAIMKFIFYFGWLNVAETLINPFGDDDEDFEVNAIINRNVQIGYMMVDGEEERFYADLGNISDIKIRISSKSRLLIIVGYRLL